jgi:acyl-coenzyme A thioesterase PaaI-like protein
MLRPTDLAFNRALGICLAPDEAEYLLELPFGPIVQNHLGTVHAAAQFALAEAASAECLQRAFGPAVGAVFAVVRATEVKYRHAGTGDLLAYAVPDEATKENLIRELESRGRSTATVLVDLKDRSGGVTFHARFEWYMAKSAPGSG